jgi:hypothetical protein
MTVRQATALRWRLLVSRWGVFAIALCGALSLWALYEREGFHKRAELLFFLQSFAGNWSPPKPQGLDSGWFVVSAVIAVALNLGAFAALINNLRSLARLERKQLMKTSRLFYLRDSVVKDELYKVLESKLSLTTAELEEWHKEVEKAYENGATAWAKSTLPAVLGKSEAADFLKIVEQEMRPLAH